MPARHCDEHGCTVLAEDAVRPSDSVSVGRAPATETDTQINGEGARQVPRGVVSVSSLVSSLDP